MAAHVERLLSPRRAAEQQARKVHEQAIRLIDGPPFDYATAVKMLEAVPKPLRETQLLETARERRDQVPRLEREIRERFQQGHLDGLYDQVGELLRLQPHREDMKRLRQALRGQERGRRRGEGKRDTSNY